MQGAEDTGQGQGMSGGSKSAEAGTRLSQETLEAVCRREPDALAVMFEHCFDAVYSLAYRLTGERTAAEDVSQEVFLKVHKATARLDPSRDHGIPAPGWRRSPTTPAGSTGGPGATVSSAVPVR